MNRLCIDLAGRVSEPCTRDNVKESYLTPIDHPVVVRLTGPVPVGATCAWSFDDGDGPQTSTFDCAEPVNFRVRYGRTTVATVDVSSSDGSQRVFTEIAVRDIFIAGLGDSVASGEGNPDRPIALSDEGFCFRSYLGTAAAQYYRPSRAGYKGGRACEAPDTLPVWQRQSALWFNPACHRSLYSYQTRTALALAVRYPHIAVTYLPLACTGATIADGLFGSQRARECLPSKSGSACQGTVNGQLAELREAAHRRETPAAGSQARPGAAVGRRQRHLFLRPRRRRDRGHGDRTRAVSAQRRDGLGGRRTQRDDARPAAGICKTARGAEAAGRRPVAGGLHLLRQSDAGDGGAPCPGGRAGFDIHPSFNAQPQRLAAVSNFVESEFLPQLKALALCEGGILCRNPRADRMTFVDGHQTSFANHGFCARAESDPEFDRQCFSATGDSFDPDIVTAASQPMLCGRSAGEYRAYLPRARWIRDANDSYFAAMTYPQGLPTSQQPADIHDATWGVLSAVYGGAVHPSAEGHAAMADAAVPAAAAVLQLDAAVPEVTSQPVAPIPAAPDAPRPPGRTGLN